MLCKFFEAGSCSRGASCTFAHGEEDLLNESLGTPATGSTATASAGSCAVAATAFATTSLADAIAQSALELKGACCPVFGDGLQTKTESFSGCDFFRGVFLDWSWVGKAAVEIAHRQTLQFRLAKYYRKSVELGRVLQKLTSCY